ncbi:hypothetical protein ABZW18_09460 [Streptomyces sp. NPDC004647]|uniref:hypothetical protein n=1 Tax=Streptomyces sp. NPDC004647 TaxID=3154671 RepID=UPI0033AE4E8E
MEPPDAASSEATRLLCAGTYLDDDFRDAVVDELYVHEERIAAPSLGIDAARVLAHALRARRLEVVWAVALVALWVLAFFLVGGFFLSFLVPCVLLVLAARLRGGSSGPFRADFPGAARGLPWYRRVGAAWLRYTGRFGMLSYAASALVFAVGDDEIRYELYSATSYAPETPAAAWFALIIPLAMAACIAAHRGQVAGAISGDLHPQAFADPGRPDIAEVTGGGRYARVQRLIRREQRSPLVYYHTQHPFIGAGSSYDPWTLAVELRKNPEKKQVELDNREILARIKPLVEALRTPANPGTPRAAAVRDRLRGLEVDECVFVRVTGVPVRAHAPLEDKHFEAERERSIEEGGEGRRHFLRIRVGAWEEELVVTVFVRVHTQGGMLMLEIAPHVLRPVRPAFHAVDRVSDTYRRGNRLGKVFWALGQLPTGAIRSVAHVFRQIPFLLRMWTGGQAAGLPDGPWASVRELGSDQGASLFQEMDASRYLKSIQDRVANGVREALDAAGWQTGEFVQQVVNVSGVYIGSAENSAIAVGDRIDLENKHVTTGGSHGAG